MNSNKNRYYSIITEREGSKIDAYFLINRNSPHKIPLGYLAKIDTIKEMHIKIGFGNDATKLETKVFF